MNHLPDDFKNVMSPIAIVYSDLLNRFRHACLDRDGDRIQRLLDAIEVIEAEYPAEVAAYIALVRGPVREPQIPS